MKIINREMGGGKTRSLVEFMLASGNEDVVYVAPTISQAVHVAYRYAKVLDPLVPQRRFISASSLAAYAEKHPGSRFVLDEVDGILGSLVNGTVLAIAGTDEDLREGQRRRMQPKSA